MQWAPNVFKNLLEVSEPVLRAVKQTWVSGQKHSEEHLYIAPSDVMLCMCMCVCVCVVSRTKRSITSTHTISSLRSGSTPGSQPGLNPVNGSPREIGIIENLIMVLTSNALSDD